MPTPNTHSNPLPDRSQINGNCYTGSSPGSGSLRRQTFPRQLRLSGISLALLPITVAGPRRSCTGFSMKPLRAPVPILYLFFNIFIIQQIFPIVMVFRFSYFDIFLVPAHPAEHVAAFVATFSPAARCFSARSPVPAALGRPPILRLNRPVTFWFLFSLSTFSNISSTFSKT